MSEPTYTPPPVSGYRKLTQAEVDLVNEVKAAEAAYLRVLDKVFDHIESSYRVAYDAATEAHSLAEVNRMVEANPRKWLATGRQHIETGTMCVSRAVFQPERS